jgi:hypothetical protein
MIIFFTFFAAIFPFQLYFAAAMIFTPLAGFHCTPPRLPVMIACLADAGRLDAYAASHIAATPRRHYAAFIFAAFIFFHAFLRCHY